jgi:ABC-type transport system substrate-binding protein
MSQYQKGVNRLKKYLALGLVFLAVLGVGLGVACGNKTSTSNTQATVPLTITQPQDEITVNTPTIQVAGVTSADATVSVNGSLVDVDASGYFSTTVSLEQGPNSIEVVASDPQGNENDQVLTVIYAT